jgi:hypothetical protein
MTATIQAVGESLRTGIPSARDDPVTAENAGIVRDWLRATAEGRRSDQEFDGVIEHGRLIFQYVACFGTGDAYYAECCRHIDRRQGLRGLVFCKWRGWIRRDQFDAWQFDRAGERAAMPSKFARER